MIISIEEFKLPTKAVDNSVDCGEFAVLSVGFYYRFVKLPKLETTKLILYKSITYAIIQGNSRVFYEKIRLAVWVNKVL
ncbi:MAG: hypothetical protein CTY19_17265 [Methylomonas sp.]|nr:MAG: hypothetical protein CTY19_17265 [Methylomonas sp.]